MWPQSNPREKRSSIGQLGVATLALLTAIAFLPGLLALPGTLPAASAQSTATFVVQKPGSGPGALGSGIHGEGWTPNGTAAISFDDPLTGPNPDFTTTAPIDGNGFFEVDLEGTHVVATDQMVTVDDGTITKTTVVSPLEVGAVDLVTETASGVANPDSIGYARLDLCTVSGPPADPCPGTVDRPFTADGGGNWTVDFSDTHDLVAGAAIAAFEQDADDDATLANRIADPRSFAAEVIGESIQGWHWTPETTVTVTVDSSDHQTTTNSEGYFSLELSPTDLAAGTAVTVDDGAASSSAVLSGFSVTGVDFSTESLSGTAQPGALVYVDMFGPGSRAWFRADAGGNWTTGTRYTATGISDCGFQAGERDDDGDATAVDWPIHCPPFSPWIWAVPSQKSINGGGWPAGSNVTATLNGGNPVTVKPDPHGQWGVHDYPTVPGDVLRATDGVTTKEMVVSPVQITDVDMVADFVTGSGRPGTVIALLIRGPEPGQNGDRHVLVDGAGHWTADLSQPGVLDTSEGPLDVAPCGDIAVDDVMGHGDVTRWDWWAPCPNLWVQLDFDSISGQGWEPNSTVAITFDDDGDPGTGTLDYIEGTADAAGNFGIDGYDPGGVDRVPGNDVTATDGTSTKTLIIADVWIAGIDVDTDVITGFATANSGVTVVIHGTPYGRGASTDDSGYWVVDFTTGDPDDYDIRPGDGGSVFDNSDEDGDITAVNWHLPPPPWITGDAGPDQVWGGGDWSRAPDAISLTIDDPATGPGVDYSTTVSMQPTEWDPNEWQFSIDLAGVVDLGPGFQLVADDGTHHKELTLTSLAITSIDLDADLVTGTADDGATVFIDGGNDPETDWAFRQVEPVGGAFTADFANPGSEPNEQDTVDLVAGTHGGSSRGTAQQYDADGDYTHAFWHVPDLPPQPWLTADAGRDVIWGGGPWSLDPDAIQLTIDDPANGPGTDHTVTASMEPFGPDSFEFSVDLSGAFDLAAGHLITVDDGSRQKMLEVALLSVDDVDADTGVVSGTAAAGASVQVNAGNSTGFAWRTVAADENDFWSVDLTVPPQPGEEGDGTMTVPFEPGTNAGAQVFDPDGDSTHAQRQVPQIPWFSVEVPYRVWGHGEQWMIGATVDLEVDVEGDGTPEHTASTTVQSWGPNPWDRGFDFYLDQASAIQLGDTVTVTAPGITKTLVVQHVTIDPVHVDTGEVNGTAPPDAWVNVNAGNEFAWAWRNVQADAAGFWTADLANLGPGDDGDGTLGVPLPSGTNISAQVADADGDTSHTSWQLRNPVFGVHVNDDSIEGFDWPDGATVHFAIDDPGTEQDPDYQQSAQVGDNPAGSHGNVGIRFGELFDVLPGHVVTATDGETLLTHTVHTVAVTDVDADADRVTGTADPGDEIWVHVTAGEVSVGVTANPSGVWVADFAPFDLQPAMQGGAIEDDPGSPNFTEYIWRVPNYSFAVQPPHHVFSTSPDWVPGTVVTLAVDDGDPANGSPDHAATTTVASWGPNPWDSGFEFRLDDVPEGETPFAIEPGFVATITAPGILRTLDVVAIAVSDVNNDTATVSGTAPPGAWVNVDAFTYDQGLGRGVHADETTGGWAAVFSVPGAEDHEQDTVPSFDSTWRGNAVVLDDDGDGTQQHWQAPLGPVTTIAGDLLVAQTDGSLWVYGGDGSLTNYRLPFDGLWDVEYRDEGRLLLANPPDARIWELDLATGDTHVVVEGGPLVFPRGLGMDPDRSGFYIADLGASVYRFDFATEELTLLSDLSAWAVKVGPDGLVYFTAHGLYRIADDGTVETVVDDPEYVLGGFVFRPDGKIVAAAPGPAAAVVVIDPRTGVWTVAHEGGMHNPEDVTLAPNGDVYIADSGSFGDDSGLYVLRTYGAFEELYRGEPLADVVELLYVPEPNEAPHVLPIQVPLIQDAEVEATAFFIDTDDDAGHAALWDWGDGAVTYGTVDEGAQLASGFHVYADPGEYQVTVTVFDPHGASGAVATPVEEPLQVEPGVEDLFAPKLRMVEFTPASVDTRSGPATLTYTLRVTDNLSGFAWGRLVVANPSGSEQVVVDFDQTYRAAGLSVDGLYVLDVVLEQYAEAGAWAPARLILDDAAGNRRVIDFFDVPPADVTSVPDPDQTPPALVSFGFTPAAIDVSPGDQAVEFTVEVTDDLGGFDEGRITVSSASGGQHRTILFDADQRTAGDELAGTYLVAEPFPRFAEAGTWQVAEVEIRDRSPNTSTFDGAALAALGFPTTTTVTSVPEDHEAPALTGFGFGPPVINTSLAASGFSFELRAEDALSGFDYGWLRLRAPSGKTLQESFTASNLVAGDTRDGVYGVFLTMAKGSEVGFYGIDQICLYDRIGWRLHDTASNRRCYAQQDLVDGGLLLSPLPEATLRKPVIVANPDDDTIAGAQWDAGWEVTVTIDGVHDYVVTPDGIGEFQLDLTGEFDLVAGQIVAADDGSFTKELLVPPLGIVAVDNGADTVTGTTDPWADVYVYAFGLAGDAARHEIADGAGNWTAVFATPGDEGGEDPFDLVPGVIGLVEQPDDDRDATELRWWVPAAVDGSVVAAGQPVAGAEVFLAPDRWTCTDAAGEFRFTDVEPGLDLTATVGRAVTPACSNAGFVDGAGRPLLAGERQWIGLYDGYERVDFTVEAAAATQPVEVERFWDDPTVCPAPYEFCWLPESLAMVQAFDLADPAFQAAFPGSSEADYPAIWSSGFGVAVEWTGVYQVSDPGGVELRYPAASDHLLLTRYFDPDLGEHAFLGETSLAADLADRGDGVMVGPLVEFRIWEQADDPDQQAEASVALLETLPPDPDVEQAITEIDAALDPALWDEDGMLLPGSGGALLYLAKAVNELGKVIDPDPAVVDAVAAVVEVARSLAQTELDGALGVAPDSPHVAKAVAEMQKAFDDEAGGKYDDAIKHYRLAWEFALSAQEP